MPALNDLFAIPKMLWNQAQNFFRTNPTEFKLKKKNKINDHSFIKIDNKIYATGEYLGHGAFGRVKKGISENSELIAIKVEGVGLDQQDANEITISKMLGFLKGMGERVLTHAKEFWNKAKSFTRSLITNKKTYKVLEYVEGDELLVLLYRHKFTLTQRLITAIKITQELQKLHQKRIIHADIKPANIKVTMEGNKIVARLLDFGISVLLPENQEVLTHPGAGTRGYMAPEVRQSKYALATDIHSLGYMFQQDFCLPEEIFKDTMDPDYKKRPSLTIILSRLVTELEKQPSLDAEAKKVIDEVRGHKPAQFTPPVTKPAEPAAKLMETPVIQTPRKEPIKEAKPIQVLGNLGNQAAAIKNVMLKSQPKPEERKAIYAPVQIDFRSVLKPRAKSPEVIAPANERPDMKVAQSKPVLPVPGTPAKKIEPVLATPPRAAGQTPAGNKMPASPLQPVKERVLPPIARPLPKAPEPQAMPPRALPTPQVRQVALPTPARGMPAPVAPAQSPKANIIPGARPLPKPPVIRARPLPQPAQTPVKAAQPEKLAPISPVVKPVTPTPAAPENKAETPFINLLKAARLKMPQPAFPPQAEKGVSPQPLARRPLPITRPNPKQPEKPDAAITPAVAQPKEVRFADPAQPIHAPKVPQVAQKAASNPLQELPAELLKAAPHQQAKHEEIKLKLPKRTENANAIHGNDHFISYDDKNWKKADSTVDFATTTQSLWVYVGGSKGSREKLLFDANSQQMLALKTKIANICRGQSVEQALALVNETINQLTDVPGQNRQQVESVLDGKLSAFLQTKMLQQDVTHSPFVSMDELIKEKLLVCRHKGLMAACLIGHLIKQGILPKGTARVYRSTLLDNTDRVTGGHGWAVYRNLINGHLIMSDPRWNKVTPVTAALYGNNRQLLERTGYGMSTLLDMIKRLNREDILLPFADKFNVYQLDYPMLKPAYIESCEQDSAHEKLCIELEAATEKQQALKEALTKQGVKFEHEKMPKDRLVLELRNNPKLAMLDFGKLRQDFQTHLQALQKPKAAVIFSPAIKRVNQENKAPIHPNRVPNVKVAANPMPAKALVPATPPVADKPKVVPGRLGADLLGKFNQIPPMGIKVR